MNHAAWALAIALWASPSLAKPTDQDLPAPVESKVLASFTTSLGPFVCELFPDKAPSAVERFLALARGEGGSLEDTLFYRAVPGFIVQGGKPHKGSGSAAFVIKGEMNKRVRHAKAGVLGLVRALPHQSLSRFYVTLAPAPWMDGRFTVIGRVVQGLEVLEAISRVATDKNERPEREIMLHRVEILQGDQPTD